MINAFEKNISKTDSVYSELIEPITILKNWDLQYVRKLYCHNACSGMGTKNIIRHIMRTGRRTDQVQRTEKFAATASAQDLIQPLLITIDNLKTRYGKWQIPWGEINRYQRFTGKIDEIYDDSKPSIPVGFASSYGE